MTLLAERCIVEGLHKGDRVLILLKDKTQFIIASYAAMRAGGIAVPLLESAPASAIHEIAKDCRPFIFITGRADLQAYPMLRDLLSCHFFFVDDIALPAANYASRKETEKKEMKIDSPDRIAQLMDLQPDDGALLLYTSGHAGSVKGTLLSHRNLIASAHNVFRETDETTIEYVTLPLAQSFGFARTICVLFSGGTIVLSNGAPNPLSLVQSIVKHQCNAISAVPATFSILFSHIESLLRTIGHQIHYVELGNSPMPSSEKRKMLDFFPNARICMHYGLTEAPRSVFIDFRHEDSKIDAAGRPAHGVEIAICNEDGVHLGVDQTGEIVIRGPHVFLRYWNNEALTQRTLLDDGWFRSGDMGFIDGEGYIHLLGRKDEMINLAGMKISPYEVEERIHAAYPDYEICVVGIPDPAGIVGEIPVLCYIGRENSTIIPSELSIALAGQIDRNKIPRIVYRMSTFPRAANKVLRHELRKQLVESMTQPLQRAM